MAVSRRSLLKGLAAVGATAGTTACAQDADVATEQKTNNTLDLPRIPQTPLLNHPYALDVMDRAGVDLLLCADPVNIYYLTNHQPVTSMIGTDGLTFAALSASSERKPIYIGNQVSYYFDTPNEAINDLIERRFYSGPADLEEFMKLQTPAEMVAAPASPHFILKSHDSHPQSALESSRLKQIKTDVTELSATVDTAILTEILEADLPNKTIAIDNQNLRRVIEMSGLDVNIVDGERLIRQIRLQKSAAEVSMMRYVAQANSIAALATAKSVRDGANFRDLRSEFSKQCGQYMCNAKYMMLDTHTAALAEGEIREGRSFLMDSVSEFEGYHGDYGRTVCIGEPNAKMQSVIDTLSSVWDRILPELKPGFAYADIHALSKRLFAESKVDAQFAVNPHTIGLHHSDDAGMQDYLPYIKDNTVLVENMVLSVDMPVLDIGAGGTAHLEDLVLITKNGPELLNDGNNRFIVV